MYVALVPLGILVCGELRLYNAGIMSFVTIVILILAHKKCKFHAK